jgi:hypothetical protein
LRRKYARAGSALACEEKYSDCTRQCASRAEQKNKRTGNPYFIGISRYGENIRAKFRDLKKFSPGIASKYKFGTGVRDEPARLRTDSSRVTVIFFLL